MPTRDCLVMAKPGGSRCNLSCDYCYYLGKEAELASGAAAWPMGELLLESYIAQRIESASGASVHFEWHGGEPTLLGLDYFRRIVELERKHLGRRPVVATGATAANAAVATVTNGLQTNGVLIDEAWADFLAAERFSVGLSLDGPAGLHDRYRHGPGGTGSHASVMRAYGLLKERNVFCNLLCVLHEANAAKPAEVYCFFRDIGAKYLQFLPLSPRPGQPPAAIAAAARPEAIGEFLCSVFDLWIRDDVGRIVVQAFDEALRPIYGAPHALCVHRQTCGDVAVLESDGSFYACDHFVDGEHRIGSLGSRSLAELSSDGAMIAFGEAKRGDLPRACISCGALASCNGGCPKDRFAKGNDGEGGLNYFCQAYKRFFAHSAPALAALAAHMKAGRSLRSFRTVADHS